MFEIFVGSSNEGRLHAEVVAEKLEKHPLFKVVPWWQIDVHTPGLSFFEALVSRSSSADFAVFVATPDDVKFKRNDTNFCIRDNVVFEFGLFSGRLGRRNVVLIQVGETTNPSDLNGVTFIKSQPNKEDLTRAAQKCLNAFLIPNPQNEQLYDIVRREIIDNVANPEFRRLIQEAAENKVKCLRDRPLTQSNLQHILEQCRLTEIVEVGRNERKKLKDFVDLKKLDEESLTKIARAFAYFTSQRLKCKSKRWTASRVAIHFKEDLRFLGVVLDRLKIRPAIVDLDRAVPETHRVKGYHLKNENVVFLHDFTTSCATPVECIERLRSQNVETRRIVSFFTREDDYRDIAKEYEDAEFDFEVFCVQKNDGTLELHA